MAKVTLSKGGFKLIPEGVTVFKVMSVDDSKYEDFGKLSVKLQTAKGETHTETFGLLNKNKELNEGALKVWSYFCRVCLNNFQVEEIDTQDIVGCYIKATVKHESYDKKDGGTGTAVRLNDYATASGFENANGSDDAEEEVGNLDEFLND